MELSLKNDSISTSGSIPPSSSGCNSGSKGEVFSSGLLCDSVHVVSLDESIDDAPDWTALLVSVLDVCVGVVAVDGFVGTDDAVVFAVPAMPGFGVGGSGA